MHKCVGSAPTALDVLTGALYFARGVFDKGVRPDTAFRLQKPNEAHVRGVDWGFSASVNEDVVKETTRQASEERRNHWNLRGTRC